MNADQPIDPSLHEILANLGQVICQPLETLRGGIGALLDDPERPISEAERIQAQTMLTLCDQLGELTRECLGTPVVGSVTE